MDVWSFPALADLVSGTDVTVPLPSTQPDEMLWNSPEVLRVDAALLLWHNPPDAAAEAEAKLLRSLDIARQQSVLSWELRSAMSLGQLWHRNGRTEAAHDLLVATYAKFTEGFGTADLINARSLIAELRSSQ
jgi:predicted ATPase